MRRCSRIAALVLFAGTLAGCDRNSQPEQVGRPAPVFSIDDGLRTADLTQMRGHVVVLNFWATWCAPCVQELPSLMAMEHQLPQVQVVAISTDVDANAYKHFLLEHHVDLLSVRDADQKTNALYGSYRFPETYIIDKQGMIRRKFIGPQEWTNPEIISYLKKLSA